MTPRDLLGALDADGILTVVDVVDVDDRPPAVTALDPDAALYVLEDAVQNLLDVLRPVLVATDREAPLVLDLPALRGSAGLLAGALIVHQAASR